MGGSQRIWHRAPLEKQTALCELFRKVCELEKRVLSRPEVALFLEQPPLSVDKAALDSFVKAHNLDDGCANTLRQQPEAIQKLILQEGLFTEWDKQLLLAAKSGRSMKSILIGS